jgi:DNA-binding transcriptional LysR family regulator
MELRHLRYFVAVAEEQNVTRAARRLHVAQPALSRQIRDLEEDLGAALFERSAASLRLTDGGRIFLNEARAVLRRTEEAVRKVRAAAGARKSEIDIGYAPSPTAEFLPRILRACEMAAPEVCVTLHDLTADEMVAGLQAKKLHAALVVEYPGLRSRELIFEKLRSYRIGVMMNKEHRLATRRAVTVGEVLAERLVVFSRNEYSDYHSWLTHLLDVPSRKLRIAQECDGVSSVIAAVEAGRGISVAGECTMLMAGSRVAFIPFKPALPPLIVGICYRRKLAASPALQFITLARSASALSGKSKQKTKANHRETTDPRKPGDPRTSQGKSVASGSRR